MTTFMRHCAAAGLACLVPLNAVAMSLESAVRFDADGFFAEFADPASLPIAAYAADTEYGFDEPAGQLSQTSVGWTFELTAPATLGGLGTYDYGADGLLVDHLVGVWRINGLEQEDFVAAELVAAALVERGATTPFDGQWRYSTDLYRHTSYGAVLNRRGARYVDLKDPINYDPIEGGLELDPGMYAIISNQIASSTNLDAAAFESSQQINFYHFVEPIDRVPAHDGRLALSSGTGPIGPGAHYDYAIEGEPFEFFPTNVQLISGMMVGPTLFLLVPEPSSVALLTLAAALALCRILPAKST